MDEKRRYSYFQQKIKKKISKKEFHKKSINKYQKLNKEQNDDRQTHQQRLKESRSTRLKTKWLKGGNANVQRHLDSGASLMTDLSFQLNIYQRFVGKNELRF